MSFEETHDGARKRSADLAALDNLHHPKPKRPRIKPPFIMDEHEDIELPVTSAAEAAMKNWYAPTLPQPLAMEQVIKTSSSPDYGPPNSPIGVTNTCQRSPVGEFTVHKDQQKQDKHKLQIAEEAIFNAIAKLKSLNSGRLSINAFDMLQKEVYKAIYNKIPCAFSVDDSATETNNRTTVATTTTATPCYRNSSTQINPPTTSTTATTTEFSYINSSTQVSPPTTSTIGTTTESSYVNSSTQVGPPTTSTIGTTTESSYVNSSTQVGPPTTSTTGTTTESFYSDASTQVSPPIEPDWTSIYKKDLELIRMKRPFVTGKGVIAVKTKLRSVPKLARPASSHRVDRHTHPSTSKSKFTSGVSHKGSAPAKVIISLDDSDDDDPARITNNTSIQAGGGSVSKAPARKFDETIDRALEYATPYTTPVKHSSVHSSQRSISSDQSIATIAQVRPSAFLQHTESTAQHTASSYHEDSADCLFLGQDGPNDENYSSVTKSTPSHIEASSVSFDAESPQSIGDNLHCDHNNSGNYIGSANNSLHNNDIIGIEDDGSYANDSPSPRLQIEDDATFYGMTGKEPHSRIASMLRFQDRTSKPGRIPAPDAGHRLDIQHFFDTVSINHVRDPEREIRGHLDRAWGNRSTLDEETAILQNWCSDPLSFKLLKGFPLVEDVVFVVPNNCAKPDGDCYWRAISFSLYGTDSHWDIVKAEHLAHVHHVLKTAGHARHQLYSEQLNKKFFKSSSTSRDGRTMPEFCANMWQVLHMAHAWTPSLMQQVTADLYNICVICFTREGSGRDDWTIVETAMRGSYNSRHIFLQFIDGNHFQPMCPNQHRPSEFRYPRITVDRTAKYSNAPKATSSKTSLQHPWRNDFTKEVPAPVPRLNGCDVDGLRQWLGSE